MPLTIDEQADAIVSFLFSTSASQQADSLVMTVHGAQSYTIGSWDRIAVKRAIVAVLAGATLRP